MAGPGMETPNELMVVFSDTVTAGFDALSGSVNGVFGLLIVLVVALTGLQWALSPHREVLASGFGKVLLIGAFAWIINDWQALSETIYAGFLELGLTAGGGSLSRAEFLNPGAILQQGWEIVKALGETPAPVENPLDVMGNMADALILSLAMIGVMLAFALLALQIIVSLLEFKIVTLGGFVLLPFGIWNRTAFLAERPLGYVVSSGLKVLALAIVVSGARAVFDQLQPSDNPDIYEALTILVTDQPASYDRLAPTDVLPERRDAAAEDAPSGAAPPSARQPAPSVGPAPRGARPADQAAASGLFFGGAAPTAADPAGGARPDGAPASAMRDYGAIYSPHRLLAPVSPYELKAGAILPGVLLTAVDTARPGPVVATVSQNVFDTVTGRHLVVPQGARLIGRHEGESAYGDRRAFLVWDRLILPNGKSVVLSEEPGVDAQGAVGVRGEADRRLFPLGAATLLAGAITTLGERARGGAEDRSVAASAGDAASIEAAQVGGRLVDRELGVQPSIRVRAGAPVRVMITRDLILEPYRR